MIEWRYRLGEGVRMARRGVEGRGRLIALIAALGVFGLAYLVFFVRSPFAVDEMVILHRRAPQWNTIVFSLDDDYAVSRIEVHALGASPELVWRVRRSGDERLSTFAYGQSLPGFETTDGPAPLEMGATYRLRVRASGARGEVEFTYDDQPTRRGAQDPRR